MTVVPPLKIGGVPLVDNASAANFLGVKVALKNPKATFEQKGLPIKAAIDNDAKSAWAIDPQFGKDHAATFEFETPIGGGDGTILLFTLKFNNNDAHSIARPRLSVTSAVTTPDLTASGLPYSTRSQTWVRKKMPT